LKEYKNSEEQKLTTISKESFNTIKEGSYYVNVIFEN